MDLTLLVGNIAIICTIASNFAGLPVCLDFLDKKSTSGVSPLPFLTAATCTSLWLQYGITVGDTVLAVVNLISVFMQTCYLACFYYATTTKDTIKRWLTFCVLFLLLIHVYVFYVAAQQSGIQILGYLASLGSISCSAATLPGVGNVLRSRSTEGLPFLMIFAGFTVTMLWYIYGVLIGDAFIKVPNLIGALLSGFQLSLFAVYDSKTSKTCD